MKEQTEQFGNRMDRPEDTLQIRHIRVLAFLMILAVQIGLMIFWAGEKSNFFIDELFSFGYAHSYTFDQRAVGYITQSDEWSCENWIDNDILKEKLVVTEQESLLTQPFATAVGMLLTRRNHQGLLNILMAIFSPGRISKLPGTLLNLFLFVLTQIILYRMVHAMTGSHIIAFLSIIMYGFSAMAIGTSIYTRFYALVILLLLFVFRLHQKIWYTTSFLRNEAYIVLSLGMIYLAMKNSELVFILAGSLIPFFFIGLLVKHDYKKAVQYFLSIVPVSVFYICKKTYYAEMILHPSAFLQREGPRGWMTRNLMRFSPEQIKSMTGTYLELLSHQLFGSWYILCCFVIIVLILLEAFCIEKKSIPTNGAEKTKGFVWILFAVSFVYTSFAFLTGLHQPRYWSPIFPLLTVLLWKLIDTLTGKLRMRNLILAFCAILTFAGIIIGELKHSDKISYVYLDERPVIRQIQEAGIQDCVVILANDSAYEHSVYECIYLLPEKARLYPVNEDRHHIDAESCPDELFIWNLRWRELQPYIEDLTRYGYTVEKLGSTHISDVYIAKRDL